MTAIFYDLETSDRNSIGQILNYCFIVTDDGFSVKDELSGEIALSLLQLPSADAILANRIEVTEHQAKNLEAEPQAMLRIAEWIGKWCRSERSKIFFIGFNSSRFDLPYLRTSLIRNGINPYFGGNLIYRDMLPAARKLAVTNKEFPRFAKEGAAAEGERLSLSLENLTQRLGILAGKQTHNSRDDVVLTIDLAKAFRERFDMDVLRYDPYEPGALHRERQVEELLCWRVEPDYDLASENSVVIRPMSLLCSNYRSALWVDLDRYGEGAGRKSICWCGYGTGAFMITNQGPFGENHRALAERARKEFEGITPDNFFPSSSCDIEQDIYRLDMQRIEALRRAIWENNWETLAQGNGRDGRVLFTRYRLAYGDYAKQFDDPGPAGEKARKILKEYAMYRYGGKLQLCKTIENPDEPGENAYHPSLTSMYERLSVLMKERSGEDLDLLKALQSYYDRSTIVKVAGAELGVKEKLFPAP